MSLLFEAIRNNDLTALRLALKRNTDAEDLKGALVNAAERGFLPLIKCLVQAGVRDDWAIVSAASFSSVKVVRYLYHYCGGNLDAALIGAAAHGRLDNVRFLSALEPKTLDEALADAVLRGYDDIAKVLLKCGGDPFTPVYGGRTAAQMAADRADKALLALFEQKRKAG